VTIPQPSFSPDLAPEDFFLFPMTNFTLDGRRWNIQESSLVEMRAIPQKNIPPILSKPATMLD
jgi:hypothetical protein